MDLIIALVAAAAATSLQPAATAPAPVPDSAATLVPVTLVELRHFADALAAIAARAGVTPAQAMNAKIDPAQRAQIIRAHGLSPARYDYIAAQVRYNDRMGRVVEEELRLASVGYR